MLTTAGDPSIPGGYGEAHPPALSGADRRLREPGNKCLEGCSVKANLARLPGFGQDKAAIFTAVLGKLRGITPEGWRDAAGYYGEPGTFRSVADIVDYDSLQKVRETKKSVKAAAKMSAG